jgi:hypothetical protein
MELANQFLALPEKKRPKHNAVDDALGSWIILRQAPGFSIRW